MFLRTTGLAVIVSVCSSAAWADTTTVVLRVDGVEISHSELTQRLKAIAEARKLEAVPPESMVRQVAVAMAQTRLMAEAAVADGLDDDTAVAKSIVEAKQRILAGALAKAYEESIDVPDFEQAARDYYDSHLDEYEVPERVQVSHILFKFECDCVDCDCRQERIDKAKAARAAQERLGAGEPFPLLAVELSEDVATASRGGSLGAWITREEVDPRFGEAAFSLEPGGVSEIVESRFGFHLIRLDDVAPASTIPFDKVKQRLIDKLTAEYKARQLAAFQGEYETRAENGTWDGPAMQRVIEEMTPPPQESAEDDADESASPSMGDDATAPAPEAGR